MRDLLRALIPIAAIVAMASVPAPLRKASPVRADDTPADWRAIEAKILPTPDETAWQAIGWETRFFDAVKKAQREKKPILLWAMNGHPNGCT